MERWDINKLREFAFYLDNSTKLSKNEIIKKLKKSTGFKDHYSVKVSISLSKLKNKACNKEDLIKNIDSTLNKIIKKDLNWNENLEGLPSAPVVTDIELAKTINIYLVASEFIQKADFKKWYREIFSNDKMQKIFNKNGINTSNNISVKLY